MYMLLKQTCCRYAVYITDMRLILGDGTDLNITDDKRNKNKLGLKHIFRTTMKYLMFISAHHLKKIIKSQSLRKYSLFYIQNWFITIIP